MQDKEETTAEQEAQMSGLDTEQGLTIKSYQVCPYAKGAKCLFISSRSPTLPRRNGAERRVWWHLQGPGHLQEFITTASPGCHGLNQMLLC